METAPDWSSLGWDMLTEIAGRLPSVEDFAAFRCVCRSWRASASNVRFGPKSGSVPLLFVSESVGSNEWKLYSILSKKIYRKFTLPENAGPWRRRPCARFGWFIMENKSGESVSLYNPFSGANIILPQSDVLYSTINLSENPSYSSKFMLMRMHRGCLHVWKPGDSEWTSTRVIDEADYYTAAAPCGRILMYCYFNGKIHAIEVGGSVWILDPDRVAEDQRLVATLPEHPAGGTSYLVGSSDGKLLYITREHNIPFRCIGKYFKLYQFDAVKGKWQEISGLDEDAVFIGPYDTSFCARANSPHTKPNCIYFVGGSEAGVYHVEDESTELFGIKSREAVWIDTSNIFKEKFWKKWI